MMTSAQIRALGLTTDPTETGCIHDTYFRSEGGPYFIAASAMPGIARRMRHRDHHDAVPDETLVAMRRPTKQTMSLTRPSPPPPPVPVVCVGCGITFDRPAGSTRIYHDHACQVAAARQRYREQQKRRIAEAAS